jgi:integrase
VSGIDKPKVQRRDVAALEPDKCRRLIAECKSHRLGDIATLAGLTGLRLGEFLALQWPDLNLSEAVLSVHRTMEERKDGTAFKELKSRAGRPTVSLDETVIQSLKSRLRKAKPDGMPPVHIALVFPNTEEKWQSRGELSRQTWYPIRKAAEIPKTVWFHDLRHTHQAWQLLQACI